MDWKHNVREKTHHTVRWKDIAIIRLDDRRNVWQNSLDKLECARWLSEPEIQTTGLYQYWAFSVYITKEPLDAAEILKLKYSILKNALVHKSQQNLSTPTTLFCCLFYISFHCLWLHWSQLNCAETYISQGSVSEHFTAGVWPA